MDLRVTIIMLILAALGLLVLHFEGLLKKPAHVFAATLLIIVSFGLRYAALDYETLDYTTFLARWVDYFRQNGGLPALANSVGNYNIPYLFFLALFSYSSISDLYLIKILSIAFDLILAWGAVRLVSVFDKSPVRRLTVYFAVLLLPTVLLNGAYWGQCDGIYVAFTIWAVYFALERRPWVSMIFIAVAFSFKLQAVFMFPLFLVLLLVGRIKVRHFIAFPVTYFAMCLPAIIAGRPILDTITLYFNQMGSVGSGLNYNSSSVYAFFDKVTSTTLASRLGIIAAALLVLAVAFWFWKNRTRASDYALLACAMLFAVGVPFLLPHMHDRYFFMADICTVIFAVLLPQYFSLALLCQFASLLGYHAYLKMQYLLPMSYGAVALALVLSITLVFMAAQIRATGRHSRHG